VQNIDLVILLEPVLFMALGAGLVVYWRVRRGLVGMVLLLSLIAYAGAIALKEVVQAYTANSVTLEFGAASWQMGVYYGLQTSFFEVGLAYLVARYAIGRKLINASDAEGYGVSLAFWENAVLLGALSFLNLSLTYLLIAEGLLPQSVYQTLISSSPALLYPPQQLIVPIALAILERISSFLAHFAWGYLCVLSAWFRKPVYLAIALPMGMLDALVPLAQVIPTWEFEGMIFAVSMAFFVVAWVATKGDRPRIGQTPPANA
jgi:YhfC intramembrane metalloprotease